MWKDLRARFFQHRVPYYALFLKIWQQPGEIIFYESASVIHGRPEAFQGDRFANIFVHFTPLEGWDITSSDVDRAARHGAMKKQREAQRKARQEAKAEAEAA